MGRILLARQHAFYAHREPNDDLTGRPIIAKPGTVCDVVRVDDSGRLLLSFTTHLYPKGVPGPLVKRTWYGWVAPDRVAPVPEEPASGEPSSS